MVVSIPLFTGDFDDLMPGELAGVISKVCVNTIFAGRGFMIFMRRLISHSEVDERTGDEC
jgi:hypothetical protein